MSDYMCEAVAGGKGVCRQGVRRQRRRWRGWDKRGAVRVTEKIKDWGGKNIWLHCWGGGWSISTVVKHWAFLFQWVCFRFTAQISTLYDGSVNKHMHGWGLGVSGLGGEGAWERMHVHVVAQRDASSQSARPRIQMNSRKLWRPSQLIGIN